SLHSDLKKYPVALLLPLHYFSFFSFVIPGDVEGNELHEWAESFIHTNIAEYELYEYRTSFFLNNSNYHCIIISILKTTLAQFSPLLEQLSLNTVYIGSGIESTGLGLADDDLFNQRVYLSGILNDKSPIRLAFESGFLCDVSEISITTSDIAIITTDDLEQVDQVCINGNNVSSDLVIPYGTGLNQLLSLGNNCNFLDSAQIQNGHRKIAKRQCQKMFIILSLVFLLLLVFTRIGVSLVGEESLTNAKDNNQKRIDQLTSEISILRNQQAQVDSIRGRLPTVSTNLEVIGRSIPMGMTLSELSMTQTGEIREIIIRGDATSESEVLLLVRDLSSTRFFQEVSIKRIYSNNSTPIATDENKVLSFEIALCNRGVDQ
ncbi:MAG: PilN domain-containing protein, partial [Candidatus Cloacimonetes bacterium]|nr:PilN domain-containing protein [Candidatus Cloacimonadota bacterium]